ncbi:uncharacterized protein I206_100261 [Kwoniella pini CBS 10737]|uniref:Zn(2)-C6 fungal-type domain-containing protein n=1 Tax=Kwoniella pini CBS 10737 TaxID=1296096 RepID=A0A1B9IE30_9TREE|nr:uncharacterized protein I206_01064 [Kwoniella pini CBS 10737]OCF53757.1 hypothetical protein I206_01064 [Kwoniella pini CBS 10737]
MGGDHKCPLCSATFTRPQHVGRHLRAHTGDRPYECKQCPLRFARSDLLSRHVNKAHKPPDENAPQKEKVTKKGRRKSLPASAMSKPTGIANSNNSASGSHENKPNGPVNVGQGREKPRASSFNQQPQLQAQRMYPHHPLLTDPNISNPSQSQMQTWSNNPSQAFATTSAMTAGLSSSPYGQTLVNPVTATGNPNAILGNPTHVGGNSMPVFDPPFTAAPMKITGSEQGYSSIGQVPITNANGIMYEWGFKKRACDQCNHSKVRCDFADPCLRCTHRNIKCSYNKPQRSRTIAYPLVPSQYAPTQSPQVQIHHVPDPTMTASPQSQFSSPYSNSSPVATTATPAPHQRHNSVSSLPPAPAATTALPARHWGSLSSMNHSANMENWQIMQGDVAISPYANMPLGTAPGNITGQVLQSPASYHPALQSTASYQAPISSQAGGPQIRDTSPPQALAATPSLTNNTTSPPDLDEPLERRTSYTGLTGDFLPGSDWQEQSKQFKVPPPPLETHNSDPTYIVPFNSSPIQQSPTQVNPAAANVHSAGNLNYQWPPQMYQSVTPNATWQPQQSGISDDANGSAFSASTNSTFLDLNDAQYDPGQSQGHHRRRSSAGQWTNALAQMTLHDSLSSSESSFIPLPEPYSGTSTVGLSIGMTSNQERMLVGADTAARRPTFPTLTGVNEESEQTESQPMPSLSDVKDLWRLFMAEPMTGLTPMGEKQKTDFDFNASGPIMTPRPGMGKRTLSKSNSMPDLQSPILNGPQFFNNFLNGLTPKPTDNQNQTSYIPSQHPAPGENNTPNNGNADVHKWSKEIQQRQSSFSLSGQPNTKLGKTQSQMPFTDSINSSHRASRPLPSVVQRSSALEQTLAPERVPSFGIPQSILGQDKNANNNNNNQYAPPAQKSTKFPSGVPPHMARPGNKRLASQTLLPEDTGKKASFSLYDGGNEFDSSVQQEQHFHQVFPSQNHLSINQTQANSMFYPNWSLNPRAATGNDR